jgi:phosphoglycolate phosphatase
MTSPQRAWDAYDAYLFDIDGTLLHCTDAVHYFAFLDSLKTLSGRDLNLDDITVQGNVDIGILRDALTLAGIPETEWRPRLDETRAAMCAHVEANKASFHATVLPAVREMLDHLRAKGAILGVATGNLEGIGIAKLTHTGLWKKFHFGGFSDAYEYRRDVFAAALAKARARTGPDAHVCVVGDTPEDIRAAKANGLDVIATATGIFSYEELEAERPTWVLHTLADLIPVAAK